MTPPTVGGRICVAERAGGHIDVLVTCAPCVAVCWCVCVCVCVRDILSIAYIHIIFESPPTLFHRRTCTVLQRLSLLLTTRQVYASVIFRE